MPPDLFELIPEKRIEHETYDHEADDRGRSGARELQVHGSGTLVRWLLQNDLIDEMALLVIPVILGQGTRLFPDSGPDIPLDSISAQTDSNGVTIHVYRTAGRPRGPVA